MSYYIKAIPLKLVPEVVEVEVIMEPLLSKSQNHIESNSLEAYCFRLLQTFESSFSTILLCLD
jgi:alpha-D-ribose 1-methylphosphonate 5-triphosphate synthase subunit PhnL